MAAGGNLEIPKGFFASQEEANEVFGSIQNPQNEDDRRRIRENYRKLQDDLYDRRQEVINPSDEQDLLTSNVLKVDQMFKEVQTTREGALDSASLANISELGKAKAQALKTDFICFNPTNFCEQVKTVVAGHMVQSGLTHGNWVTLGKAVHPFFRRTPVLKFMYGSFDRGEVVVKPIRQQREKLKETDDNQKASKPIQLSSFEETDRGELTTAQVEHLLSTLWNVYEKNDEAPICFFEFVVHPTSFGQTVENIFYTSFLVRDGHARVFLDGEDLPVIEPIQKGKGDGHEAKQRRQIVLSITPAEWEEIVRTFNIEQPLISGLKKLDTLKGGTSAEATPQPTYSGKGKSKAKKT
ncbi:unnamed protein product [Lymnaea stagnalis]|uniref:Non-structural maintenance of chromosomes element 4 n=1 Tax=Lymnaea stagnalis TaxID=6523 RepID=A0AAV2ICB1_LYMST